MVKTCLACMNFQKQLAFERDLVKKLEIENWVLSEKLDQAVEALEEQGKELSATSIELLNAVKRSTKGM